MSRDLILVAISLFTWGIGEGMFYMFQPLYLQQWGASPILIGALLGGMVLGMIESFAGAYLGTYTMGTFGAEYKDMVAFLILIIVIVFRPNGLLGEQISQKA